MRHHVLIKNLSKYGGKNKNLRTKKIIERKFSKNLNIYFVYGNGGMYADKPSIACFEHGNFTHILNGIGEFDDDYIIVINQKKLYRLLVPNLPLKSKSN